MSKNKMPHMNMKWRVKMYDGVTTIVTRERNSFRWCVAEVYACFPGDESGLKTARAICDAHNKELKEGRITQ